MKARPKMKKHFIKKDTHQVLILHLKSNYTVGLGKWSHDNVINSKQNCFFQYLNLLIGSLSIQVFQYFITETLLA